ncbi:mitochondrial import receptor protein [Bachmanniomyces sp. S44760]|nr:mitochondrial import receptor protein [Bachmanniomyces sp. S44760]
MVQLEEVEDEELDRQQPGGEFVDDDDDFEDTDSEISSINSTTSTPANDLSESLTDRLLALKDIVPPTTRRRIASATTTTSSYILSGLFFSGKALWVVSTSALLVGVPWALAFAEEQQVLEMEKEQKMRDLGNEVLVQGGRGEGAGRA